MHRLIKYLLLTLIVATLGGYAVWSQYRPEGHYLSDLRSTLTLNQGEPSARGNLLGIQPELFALDYQSSARLRLKLAAYLDHAQSAGLLNPLTIVVLPEHIGTWLLVSGEKQQLYHAESLTQAMTWLAAGNPLALLRALPSAKGDELLTDALLRMKAAQMARDYQQLFGELASTYGVTLVAGSIVLPEPQVIDGILTPGDGPLYNVSLAFGTDGKPLGQPQRKVVSVSSEEDFTANAASQALQVIDTPTGRLGVLICAGNWPPEHFRLLADQQVELLAVPAFLTGNHSRNSLWGGCNGTSSPADVNIWQRRIADSGASAAITIFLRGRLWDMTSAGESLIVSHGQYRLTGVDGGAQLVNLWL
jgi:predicted amidohydrolase